MVKLFRHIGVWQILILVVLAITLWFPTLAVASYREWIAFAFFVINALIINTIIITNHFFERDNLLAILTSFLIMSLMPSQHELTSFSIALPFILIAVNMLVLTNINDRPINSLVSIAVCLAVAAMICPSCFVLLPLVMVYISLNLSRYGNKKFIWIPFFSFLMTLIFCVEIIILIGEFSTVWKAICVDFQGIRYSFSHFRGANFYFILILTAIFFYFYVRIKYLVKNPGKILKSFVNVMFFIFLIGVFILPFFSRFTDDGFLFLPLIVVLSVYFSCIKKVFFANIFLILMILFSIINQYYVVITGV